MKKLYLLNDDVNSFEDVVNILRRYLSYPTLQGHSIASIVHQNGSCCVYTGEEVMVERLFDIFISNGFNVRIGNDDE
jgi:ATP-dependent Clp protease adapter protein ClpS